jgi:transposase-like protein
VTARVEPRIIGKRERHFTGFDDKIIATSARGMTVREIQGFLSEMYSLDVSPEGVISPLLASLYLHDAFKQWMVR